MANTGRTKVVFWLGAALLVAFCGGCAAHQCAGPELAGAGAPGASPCDPYYTPPCSIPCPIDPTCFGYHPTCWTPWPEFCTGCPPPAVVVESLPVPTDEGATGEPSFASPSSVFDGIEPPVPSAPDLLEPEMVSPPGMDTPTPASNAKQKPSPFLDEALRREAQTQPDRDLALRPTTNVDADATGDGEEDSTGSEGSTPPAPLPNDLWLFTVAAVTAETKLPAPMPDERSAETDGDEVGARGNRLGHRLEALPEPSTPAAAKARREAFPLGSAAAKAEGLNDPPGWASCSDDQGPDAIESSPQIGSVRSALSRDFNALSSLVHSSLVR